MGASPPEHPAPRLAEVVAAFSLATDIGLGQPMEHGLRSCLIATRFADALDLDDAEREAVYWVTLLAMVGCTADSFEIRQAFGARLSSRPHATSSRARDQTAGRSGERAPASPWRAPAWVW
jgi:hypothetical protein